MRAQVRPRIWRTHRGVIRVRLGHAVFSAKRGHAILIAFPKANSELWSIIMITASSSKNVFDEYRDRHPFQVFLDLAILYVTSRAITV